MKGKILRFKGKKLAPHEGFVKAHVVEVDDGEATQLTLSDVEGLYPVVGHGDGVTRLKPGDKVLAAGVGDGFVVIERMRNPGTAPAAHLRDRDGTLAIEAEREVRFNCGPWSFSMQSDGVLTIRGKSQSLVMDPEGGLTVQATDTTVDAREGVYIRGGRIEFN